MNADIYLRHARFDIVFRDKYAGQTVFACLGFRQGERDICAGQENAAQEEERCGGQDCGCFFGFRRCINRFCFISLCSLRSRYFVIIRTIRWCIIHFYDDLLSL